MTRGLKLALALCLVGVAGATPARAATVISLTFDDGQATQYAVKSPLQSHGMDATFFLNSSKIGTSSYYMTWTQASALGADGNDIGGHTLNHLNLTTLSDSQARTEVCNDRQNLVAHGFNPKSFAYPYGASNASVQAIVRDCGYLSARRVGGIVSPNWCPDCGTPRAESIPPASAYDVRTPSFGNGELTLAALQNVIIQAEGSGGGWIPFLFHGVCETATCGEGWVRPSTFSALLDWLQPRAAHGTVVRTVKQVIENAPPETSIDSKPPALTPERSASFTLSSNRSPVTFECSLDFGAWQPCQSPVSYTGLAVGGHSFRARARDQLGAVDPTPAAWTWTIETEPGAGAPTVVSLTFDDGQATQYKVKQALADHGMHGTFFVNSEDVCVTNCGPGAWAMTWDQIEALAADGNEIGGHTLEHIDLTDGTIPLSERRRQVCDDHANLTARGFDPVSFAYPYGHVDATAESLVEECGYASGRGAGDAPAAGETIPPLDPFSTRTPGHSSGELTLSEFQQQITASENAGGGWVQLAFHGVCDTKCGEGWVKQATFEALLDWLEPRAADGTIVRTVREVMGRTNPETSIASGPSGTVASTSASFAFSSPNSGVTFECRLDGGTWGGCTSPKAYSGLGQGAHTFAVRAVDGAGNLDPSPATRTWTVDTVAPDTSVTGPSGPSTTNAATFAFSSPDATADFECSLDGGAWTACDSPKSYSGLAEGSHTFSVKAVDPAGNADPTPASRTWTVDTVVPDTQIAGGPSGPVNTSAASFPFSSPEPGVEFECKLDAGAWGACTSPKSYAGLAEGGHSFAVRAHDAAGNVDATPATRSWSVDTVAPDTSITGGPNGTVPAHTAELSFSSPDAGASFQCSLDGGEWTACGSPKIYTGLDDGSHTFSVRAVDAVGNGDATPATRTWSIDSVGPDTSISSGPSGTVAVTQASFAFSSPEGGAAFQCRLDAGEWASCASPRSHTGLGDGAHSFSVRAVDAVGNIDPTPATRAWIVDTTAPGTVINAAPSEMIASKAARFEFSSADTGAGFECKLDAGGWAGCTSPKEYSGLADGAHAFSVRAVDAAGNADSTPETKTWTIDTTPPDTAITAGPSGTLDDGDALFWWSATEDGSFECRLDGGAWAPCSEPKAYAGLADGSHTFEVRASDELGNWDPTPATRTWTVQRPVPPPPPGEQTPTTSGGEPSPTSGTPDTGTPDPTPPAEPSDDDRPPAESENPEPDPAAAVYLRRVLVAAVKANKGKRLKRIVRSGKVRIRLPHSNVRGALRFELALLPDPPGPSVRLGRASTRAPVGSRMLDELKLGKRARKRLARLWVAAIEITATFSPDSGGVVHDRAVFLARR